MGVICARTMDRFSDDTTEDTSQATLLYSIQEQLKALAVSEHSLELLSNSDAVLYGISTAQKEIRDDKTPRCSRYGQRASFSDRTNS